MNTIIYKVSEVINGMFVIMSKTIIEKLKSIAIENYCLETFFIHEINRIIICR